MKKDKIKIVLPDIGFHNKRMQEENEINNYFDTLTEMIDARFKSIDEALDRIIHHCDSAIAATESLIKAETNEQ
jgi:hypothetical protein